MNCNRWREQASDYIEGTLPLEAMTALKEHLAACPSCRADEAALRVLWREMNVLPVVETPLFFRDNVVGAIERSGIRKGFYPSRQVSVWERLFPQPGRLAWASGFAVVLVAGVLVANSLNDNKTAIGRPSINAEITNIPGLSSLLPYRGESVNDAVTEHAAKLVISRVQTVLPEGDPVYDLLFWLENADKGTAKFQLLSDPQDYRFPPLTRGQAQTLRVPFSTATNGVVGLSVHWTAGSDAHTKFLFIPTDSEKPRDTRQSFGLPEQSLLDTARDISSRYGKPVTLEDVPGESKVALIARGETATETLRRHLEPLNLRVTSSPTGILITPEEK